MDAKGELFLQKKHRVILIGHGGISLSYIKAFSAIEDVAIVGVVGRDM